MRILAAVVTGLALLGGNASADPVCGARVTVREVGRQANDDGTRTLKYRAVVLADPAEGASCARVSFNVMRSYVKADGSTAEAGIPVAVDAKKRSTTVDGEDVLPTSPLVYWWADQVRCEPCAAEAPPAAAPHAAAGKKQRSDLRLEAEPGQKAPSKGRKKAAAALGVVALSALFLL
jgi:hypothetical protein